MNGTTTNGRINYPSANKVVDNGTRGSERPSKPQASQVGTYGAHDPGTGRKFTPETVTAKAYGNDAEQRAVLAQRMYPSSKGSRFA